MHGYKEDYIYSENQKRWSEGKKNFNTKIDAQCESDVKVYNQKNYDEKTECKSNDQEQRRKRKCV